MKILNKILIVSVLSLMVVSCSKDRTREQKVSAMIDKINSPFFIASMNLQNLMDKSEVMEEGTLPFTQYQVISFFLAADVTGIDYDTDAQIIIGEGESFIPNFYGIFKIKDQDKFVELIEVEANATIQEKDDMKYAIKDTEGYCVVWNEEFAIISNIPMDLAAMLSGKGNGGQKMVDKNIAIIQAAEEGEINEEYVSFLGNDADMAMSFDGKPFYSYMKTMSMEDGDELEKMKELYEGMSYDIFLNFENGKVELEMIAELDKELKDKLSFLGKSGVSKNLFSYGKTSSPMLTGTYKVDVNGFLDYFEGMSEEDYQKMLDELDEAGMKIEDIKDAFSGEIVFMIEEVVKKEEVYDFGYDDPIIINEDEPIFGIVIGVKDASIIQAKMEEAMLAASLQDIQATTDIEIDSPLLEDLPEITMLPNGVINIGDAFMFLTEDVMFMTNDSTWANLVASGNAKKVDNPNGILTEKAFGFYADLTKLNQMEGMEEQADMMAMLKSFYGSADLDGGKFTLELMDDSQNSLKVLTVMIGSAMAEFEKSMNPDLEAELEEAIDNPDAAFDKLEEELENIDLDEVEDVLEEL